MSRLFATPWTVAYQAPLSMGFSRQEYWSGLPFPSPGDLPNPGIEPWSPTLQADALTSEPPGKPMRVYNSHWFTAILKSSQEITACFFLRSQSYFLGRIFPLLFSSVQFSLSVVSDSLRPHRLQHARLPCPTLTPRVYSHSGPLSRVMPSNHLILCLPLLFQPSIFPSIKVFSNESDLRIRWPKYWSFSFINSRYNEYSGLISFRMDWLDLLAVQEILRIFSNTTVQKHQFFCAQLSL